MNKLKGYLMLVLLAMAGLACDIELVTPTPEEIQPQESVLPTPTAVRNEGPSQQVLADDDESLETPVSTIVTVTHETVNLRFPGRAASGSFVQKGQVLAVQCGIDGYCLILEGEHAGLYIWRGCTSDPADYGCQAK